MSTSPLPAAIQAHLPLAMKVTAKQRNRVRIIGGQWRSRLIDFADAPGLRPSTDRVRETLFNWLGQDLTDWNCLDLFAGSGVLGFEAASRGAEKVVMVEKSRIVWKQLTENKARLVATGCELVNADALAFLKGCHGQFDLIFVDPPFDSSFLPGLLPMLAPKLAAGGRVYLEWGQDIPALLVQTGNKGGTGESVWQVDRQGRAGTVHFALLSFNPGS